MTAPTLRTARLTLTGHSRADLDDCAAMWADPAVYALIGGQPRPREEVWIRLLRSVGQWTLTGYGAWVVRETATGRFVGDVGLLDAERAIDPPLVLPEVGWALSPAFHGRGMALEALEAALGWADPVRPAASSTPPTPRRSGWRPASASRRPARPCTTTSRSWCSSALPRSSTVTPALCRGPPCGRGSGRRPEGTLVGMVDPGTRPG